MCGLVFFTFFCTRDIGSQMLPFENAKMDKENDFFFFFDHSHFKAEAKEREINSVGLFPSFKCTFFSRKL